MPLCRLQTESSLTSTLIYEEKAVSIHTQTQNQHSYSQIDKQIGRIQFIALNYDNCYKSALQEVIRRFNECQRTCYINNSKEHRLTVIMGFLAYHLKAVTTKQAANPMLITTASAQQLLSKYLRYAAFNVPHPYIIQLHKYMALGRPINIRKIKIIRNMHASWNLRYGP